MSYTEQVWEGFLNRIEEMIYEGHFQMLERYLYTLQKNDSCSYTERIYPFLSKFEVILRENAVWLQRGSDLKSACDLCPGVKMRWKIYRPLKELESYTKYYERVQELELNAGLLSNLEGSWESLDWMRLFCNDVESTRAILTNPMMSNVSWLSLHTISESSREGILAALCESPYLGRIDTLSFERSGSLGGLLGVVARNSLAFTNLRELRFNMDVLLTPKEYGDMVENLQRPLEVFQDARGLLNGEEI